jgi:phage terminase Nu1 subunit (DNA packaging protein)
MSNKKIVDKAELAKALNIKARQISNYVKQGMPVHSVGKRNKQSFDVDICLEWQRNNINKTMSMKTKPIIPKETEINIENEESKPTQLNDALRKLKAEADDAELKVKLNEIKLAEAEGRVVDANDLDKAMAEQAIMHKTDKINDENLLPILLENKSKDEIKKLLIEHNSERLKMLDALIKKEFEAPTTLYEIVEVVLQKLSKKTPPDEIIKALERI